MSTPFALAARAYLDSGWSPIPLPHEQKFPVPDQFPGPNGKLEHQSFTGADGVYVTEAHLAHWLSAKGRANAGKLSYRPGNIAIRLPPSIVGVDVDAYSGKKGAETLAKAEMEWGALPPTWVSTSKDDGVSGIRWYRVPIGLAWPGELPQGKGVELIRWDHRFAIVAPSVHDKTGEEYRWYREVAREDGSYEMVLEEEEFPDAPPERDEEGGIPWMPKEWIEGLTGGEKYSARATDDGIGADDVRRWIANRPAPEEPCRHMRKQLTAWTVKVQRGADDGGAHQEMVDAVWAVLSDARQGHTGVGWILTKLRNVFLQAVKDRRPDDGSARSEWARAVVRGANKIMSDGNEAEEEDPCEDVTVGTIGGRAGGSGSGSSGSGKPGSSQRSSGSGSSLGSADIETELNDLGNANRLVRVMAGRARWVEVHGAWYVWSEEEGRWREDDKQVNRWTVKAMVQIEEEAALLAGGENGEALAKAWMAHRKSSLKVGALGAAREMAKSRKGMEVEAELLDAEPSLLGTPDGVLVLGRIDEAEVVKRNGEWARDKFITMRTRVPWKRGASSRMWEEFLSYFQPDEEIREWLQRITGYSLLGSNPDRLLIVQRGKTSSGKSTFSAAIQEILGDYAGTMPASVLRDNPDDKPRPDLLGALARRIVIAEEMGAAQHLHADQVKRITGGTKITARGMRSNAYIDRFPSFTPWLVANDVPTIEGADAALLRRVLVVPWDVQIAPENEDIFYLQRLLSSSSEAILAWAIEGHEMWLKSPRLRDIPAGALQAAGDFAEGVNDLGAWLSARTDRGDDFYEIPARLYEDYEGWCAENGIEKKDGKMSSTAFGRRLAGLGMERDKRSIGGKQVHVRMGIRLVSGDVSAPS
jgi:P4 family phage/plasmid primase-like protien